VIEAVAATTDREPTAMPPLYESLDPDALDAVLTPRTNGVATDTTVSFTYGGVTVQVDNSGWIEVRADTVSPG
jgi:hypothetical protein